MIAQLEAYFDSLWPINRSLAGPGFLASLDILSKLMPHERLLFPSGSQALDWTVPMEWHPRTAYIVTPDGRRIADLAVNNLHLVSYSNPFRGRVALAELKEHLHTRPDLPDAIPFVTAYYKDYWGFCIPHTLFETLTDGEYEVVVDTYFIKGNVVVAEAVLPGSSRQEVLITSYLCHPSLANNELSGPLTLCFLYRLMQARRERHYTYRFVLMPETIGAICYLSMRGEHFRSNLTGGLLLSCLGDKGPLTFKSSRRGDTLMDRTVRTVLAGRGEYKSVPFDPSNGSDERQYCSPGFNLPLCSLSRSIYGMYPEYHTSLDNKSIMNFEALEQSVVTAFEILAALENNCVPVNLAPYGEPQLGRRKLYPDVSSAHELAAQQKAMMWLLNLGDGEHDLISIAERSGLAPGLLEKALLLLEGAQLMRRDVYQRAGK